MDFSIIGGDLRLSNLAIMLADDDNEVTVYGMENSKEVMNDVRILKQESLEDTINQSKIIIGSIPFLNNKNEMYATFSDKSIKLEDLLKEKHLNQTFIAGNIPDDVHSKLKHNYRKVIDIMKSEELEILNTIAAAEGAIDLAIRNTDTILHGSKVLILGFGGLGKEVAKKFHELSTKVTCVANEETDLAWIKALGYEVEDTNKLKENLKKYDIIINTIPEMVIDEHEMQYMDTDTLLIDLASTPKGINIEDAKKMNIKFIWAQELPSKIAPVTTAKFIKETIYNLI